MLFTDDIVLIHETRVGVNNKLEQWRYTLESSGLALSRSKIEYLHCGFSGREKEGVEVTIDGMTIPKANKF